MRPQSRQEISRRDMKSPIRPRPEARTAKVPHAVTQPRARASAFRSSTVILSVTLAFMAVAGQLTRLAVQGGYDIVQTLNEPIATSFARPDLVDRNGRLLATDVEMPSLFADPAIVQSRDVVAERLADVLPNVDPEETRRLLEDRTRRFVWLRRGLSPRLAQSVHDLGLPGLSFRDELRRAYPLEELGGHILGAVNIDNRGIAGIERFLDDERAVEAVHGAAPRDAVPIRLSLDIGIQHALEDELHLATSRYGAKGAAGIVMDVATGEIVASSSEPGVDPGRPRDARDPDRIDRVHGGTFELGSIFKMVTIAMSLDDGKASLDTIVDVTKPLTAGKYTITDTHPAGRPLSVAEVFTHSSNVGAGLLALDETPTRQREFLEALGLWQPMRTEQGPVSTPQLPARIDRAEQITLAYGHGIAVAPIQFARAAAALVNGGTLPAPTYLARTSDAPPTGPRVIKEDTSRKICDLLRRNVTEPHGTGKRADVEGYRVGGKTGTAEIAGPGGYQEKAVIASFLAAFPMDAPRYVVLVSIFEPKGTSETDGEITAGRNAAPTAGRIIARIAPKLGVLPQTADAGQNALR